MRVPLGSTRDILITCHVSATGKGKLHGSPECRTLRSAASVNQIDVLFGEAVARLCPSCRWPLPTDSLILPLGAAVSEVDSLAIWLDRESKDEEDLEAERDAAIALAAGEYPPRATESGDEEEKDDDEAGRDEEWERYDRARNFRSRRHEHWRRLHSCLGSHTGVSGGRGSPLVRSPATLTGRQVGWACMPGPFSPCGLLCGPAARVVRLAFRPWPRTRSHGAMVSGISAGPGTPGNRSLRGWRPAWPAPPTRVRNRCFRSPAPHALHPAPRAPNNEKNFFL
ncbi:hypothetical protein SATRM34S_00807 [Streptomyces atroolivaceus]